MNVSIVLKLLDGVTAPIKKLAAAVAEANKAVEATKKNADKAFDQAKNIKIAGDGVKQFAETVNSGIKDITDPFKSFEQAMTRVRAVSGASTEDFNKMSLAARAIGATGKASAVEAAQAFELLSQSGIKASERQGVLQTALDRSRIAQVSLHEAIEATLDTTKAFGLSLSQDVIAHVNDVTTAVAKASGTSFSDMSRALETSGVAAKAAGVSFERTAMFVGLLSQQGIQGEKAGDALRAMFGKLVNPEMVAQLNAVGVKTNEMVKGMKQARDPLAILTDLQKSMTKAGFNNARQLGILGKVVGDEAAPRIQALLAAAKGKGLDELSASLKDVTGAAADMAKAMEGPEDATKKLKGTTQELFNVIAESMMPTLRDLEQRTIKTRIALTGWLQEHPVLTKAIGLLAVAVGVLATALGGLLTVTSALIAAKGYAMLAEAMGVKMPLAIIKGFIPAIGSAITSMGGLIASFAVAAAPVIGFVGFLTIMSTALLQVIRLAREWKDLDFAESFKGLKESFGDGSFWKTLSLNPFEGLNTATFSNPATALGSMPAIPPSAALGVPAAMSSSAMMSEAPKGTLTIQIDQDNRASVKKPQSNGGINLELGAGVPMSY